MAQFPHRSDIERLAILETQIEDLDDSVKKLTDEIKVLTGVMNQGKGAFAFAMILAGAVGGIATKLATKLLG